MLKKANKKNNKMKRMQEGMRTREGGKEGKGLRLALEDVSTPGAHTGRGFPGAILRPRW